MSNILEDAATAAKGMAQMAVQKVIQLAPDSFIPGGRPRPADPRAARQYRQAAVAP